MPDVKPVFDSQGSIGKALTELRAEGGPGLDWQGLAEQAGVSVDTLSRLDKGQFDAVRIEELERLCRVLGRSPNDLLGYESDE